MMRFLPGGGRPREVPVGRSRPATPESKKKPRELDISRGASLGVREPSYRTTVNQIRRAVSHGPGTPSNAIRRRSWAMTMAAWPGQFSVDSSLEKSAPRAALDVHPPVALHQSPAKHDRCGRAQPRITIGHLSADGG